MEFKHPKSSTISLTCRNGASGNTPISPLGDLDILHLDHRHVQTLFGDQIHSAKFADFLVNLRATSDQGLPVTHSVLSGPAEIEGEKLNLTGFAPILLGAKQSGNRQILPANRGMDTDGASSNPHDLNRKKRIGRSPPEIATFFGASYKIQQRNHLDSERWNTVATRFGRDDVWGCLSQQHRWTFCFSSGRRTDTGQRQALPCIDYSVREPLTDNHFSRAPLDRVDEHLVPGISILGNTLPKTVKRQDVAEAKLIPGFGDFHLIHLAQIMPRAIEEIRRNPGCLPNSYTFQIVPRRLLESAIVVVLAS
ncbi:MAG: hypothetical protein M2R45_01292 [Verrucomicrobia subdivision 3 bacterium]|nr:hypothetical protein [Limisphaerales bacterium]MCS1415158.1 hypothetical protein [Limisphaerales bacterium]